MVKNVFVLDHKSCLLTHLSYLKLITHDGIGWGRALQGYDLKVTSRSSQGHFKVKWPKNFKKSSSDHPQPAWKACDLGVCGTKMSRNIPGTHSSNPPGDLTHHGVIPPWETFLLTPRNYTKSTTKNTKIWYFGASGLTTQATGGHSNWHRR